MRAARSSGVMAGRCPRPTGWSGGSVRAGAGAGGSRGRRVRRRGPRLDLGLRLGRLGLGVLDAPPRAQRRASAASSGRGSRSRATRMMSRTSRKSVGMRGWYALSAARAKRDRDHQPERGVRGRERARPCCRRGRAPCAAAMTSTSRRVAALPLRETTQIAPFGRIRVASVGERRQLAVESAPSRTTSVSGSGQPSVRSVGAVGEQRAESSSSSIADDRDAHPGPDAELVEERRRVDPFHRRYRATHASRQPLLVFGPRSSTTTSGRAIR